MTDKVKAKKTTKRKVPSKAKVKKNVKEHALALTSKRLSKTDTGSLTSLMGDSAEAIQQLLENNEGDSAKSLLYKKLLQTLVDLVPYTEQNIRDSQGAKGVYQLTSLITNIRELLIDIQSSQDRGRLGELIVERIINPAMLDIGSSIVQRFYAIESDAKGSMSSKDYAVFREDIKRQRDMIAADIMRGHSKIKDEIIEQLQR